MLGKAPVKGTLAMIRENDDLSFPRVPERQIGRFSSADVDRIEDMFTFEGRDVDFIAGVFIAPRCEVVELLRLLGLEVHGQTREDLTSCVMARELPPQKAYARIEDCIMAFLEENPRAATMDGGRRLAMFASAAR